MAWIALIIAGLFEVLWATAMKQSYGLTRLLPSVVTIVGLIVSFGLLAWAMRVLPLGAAYTVWTGIGAVGAFIVGIIFFGEAITMSRILDALLVLAGLALMRISSQS